MSGTFATDGDEMSKSKGHSCERISSLVLGSRRNPGCSSHGRSMTPFPRLTEAHQPKRTESACRKSYPGDARRCVGSTHSPWPSLPSQARTDVAGPPCSGGNGARDGAHSEAPDPEWPTDLPLSRMRNNTLRSGSLSSECRRQTAPTFKVGLRAAGLADVTGFTPANFVELRST